ncbi:hypothetical protein MTX20_11790 [Bradyrhizobium sp. ISRA435]|nr:hypothetical protein MTX20_11790 [Bradyrhizobium sp. ISRA435]
MTTWWREGFEQLLDIHPRDSKAERAIKYVGGSIGIAKTLAPLVLPALVIGAMTAPVWGGAILWEKDKETKRPPRRARRARRTWL